MILGFVLVFSPEVIADNIHWGVAPTWSQFAIAIPVAMLAYTGVETVSNLAEEARDPARTVPAAYKWVAGAVFAIYFTLPLVALSAMPVQMIDGELTTLLALPPEEGGYANDPILGVVDNLGVTGLALDGLQIYVGILAATILIVATNAGVIGASRITYSMATYRQIPERLPQAPPALQDAVARRSSCSRAWRRSSSSCPGTRRSSARCTRSGRRCRSPSPTPRSCRLRMKPAEEEEPYRARPNLRLGGVDWPLFAVLGGIATGISLRRHRRPERADALGGARLDGGRADRATSSTAARVFKSPLAETVKAPPALGPAMALEYRTIVVPIVAGEQAREAMHMAARLAAERRSTIVAMRVIVVPLELPLNADLPEQEALADELLDEAHDIGDLYGVRVVERVVRGRDAGAEIVAEAERRNAEIIVMGAPRLPHRTRTSAIFGKTADYVLRNAPCRVMIAAARRAA